MASNDPELPHLVFVYGNLKPGEKLEYKFYDETKGKAKYIGPAKTISKYPLIVTTKYNMPLLLDIEGEGHHVQGAVFKVDDAMLAYCDELEVIPLIYNRGEVSVELEKLAGEDAGYKPGDHLKCYAYVFRKYTEAHLKEARYELYSRNIFPFLWPEDKFHDIDEILELLGIPRK